MIYGVVCFSLDALWSFVIGPCSSSGSSSSLASSLTSSCTVESVCAEIELITASFIVKSIPLKDDSGEIIGAIEIFSDHTERNSIFQTIKNLEDPLLNKLVGEKDAEQLRQDIELINTNLRFYNHPIKY